MKTLSVLVASRCSRCWFEPSWSASASASAIIRRERLSDYQQSEILVVARAQQRRIANFDR